METAGTVLDRGESANCIPSLGFGFGPTVFAGFEISCTIHTAIELNVLGNFGNLGVILDRFRRCLVLDYGD